MAFQANNRNGGMLVTRNERSMPKWVTEQTDRIGPKPPPPPVTPENGDILIKQPNLPPKTKTLPEPDYEVIEFSNQQYSNTPLRPNSASSGSKTPDNKLKCTLCGSGNPWVTCDECAQQIFCASCDDMFHKHPKRKNHQRKTIEKSLPPLPPKILPGQTGPSPPVAPPRRNKRGLMTPLMQRKDQGNSMPGPFPVSSSPTPSQKNGRWQERFGSLPRGLNLLNRPLPDTPKTPPSESSRSTTPKSVFDNIQRPPSITLEKIKSKANATLDRMQLLQQRYRQQKERLERERSGSVTDQNMSAFDQWSSISQSPSHFHSGSMSSGINSSHLDLMDDNNFNFVHQRQLARQHHQLAAQRANQLGQRALSTSVFNLNHINRKQAPTTNGWMNNSMQQAQSMAQLNCANCAHQQSQWNGHSHMHMPQDQWCNQLASQQHLNRSNMSLNVAAGYMMQPQMNGMYPPPAFMNQRALMQQMYPQPYMGGMPVMNPGLISVPPSASRAGSRAGSRMASPAMSRKSVTLRRKQRSNYIDDEATDDEDSDEEDRRSITSNRSGVSRSRQRRLSSASQINLDENIDLSHSSKLHRHRARNQRRDSIAKSVHNDWAPGRRGSNSNTNNRSADSGFNSPLKPSRIYSDLDSEGSGTRALVQAKIEQKLKEESLKQKQTKSKRQSQSPTPKKTSAAVQTPAVKKASKQEDKRQDKNEVVTVNKPAVEDKLTMKIESQEEEIKTLQKYEHKQATASEEEEETESKEEDEDEESESEPNSPEPDVQTNNNEAVANDAEIVEDNLGPPPSTPDHEWECEFCTFVNEANIKICSICCKTPSIKPKKAIKAISPPKQMKTTSTEAKERTKGKDKDRDKSGTIKKRPTTTTAATTAATTASNSQISSDHIVNEKNIETTNSINAKVPQTTKTDSAHSTDEAYDSSTNAFKTKDTVEDVWATLDENIQTTAHAVTRKAESKKTSKDSATVGINTSTNSHSASVEPQENGSSKFQGREIGTSPPPQSISTQTYDSLNICKQTEAKETSQLMFNDVIQPTSFPPSPAKIQDLKSFEAEVLNKIHNISHVPSHHHHNQYHIQQQQLHNYHANHHNMYPFNDPRQRYRSNNDLHMDDAMSMEFEGPFNGLSRRQLSISELMLSPKVASTSSQMHSPLGGSIYDLPYRDQSSLRLTDMDNHKESDLYKYTTEELNAALKYCGPDMHPLVWLRDNWPKLIQTVQSLATKYGQERAENTIGTISQMEAREALRLHTGNIWQAVSECIEQRQRKYREISSKGNFSREDIVTALTTQQGNMELALHDLGRNQLKPFLMRIWGSPGGVENESGSSLPLSASVSQTSQPTAFNIDKDIHNFLSVNASDCMQTPNESGAFHNNNNNQMPSPFDRPAPFTTSFDNNNHILDYTSSYSADSKDFAATTSPLPIDESILSNKNLLKDLETLIGNMEQNQQKPNEHVLRSIHDMITNINQKPDNDSDPEAMRILTKSPITPSKYKTSPKENQTENETDVKNFVWQHIQEIVPNLVQQVEMELMEDIEEKLKASEPVEMVEEKREMSPDTSKTVTAPPPPPPPPIDQDEFLMEEVIKPNIKNASIKEELTPQYRYPSEIATFQMTFDKGLQRNHEEEFEFDSLEEAERFVYKMFKAPQIEEPIQVLNSTNDSCAIQGELIDSAESQTIRTKCEIQTNIPAMVSGVTSTIQNLAEHQSTDSSKKNEDTTSVESKHFNETKSETESSNPTESHQVKVQEETNNPSIEIIAEPMEPAINEINVPVLDTKTSVDIPKATKIEDEAQSSSTVTTVNTTEALSKTILTENENLNSQEPSSSNDPNNSDKNVNFFKRTTVQDLSKALHTVETVTNSDMEPSALAAPLTIDTLQAELQLVLDSSITAGNVKAEFESPSTSSVAVDTLSTPKPEFEASEEKPEIIQLSTETQVKVLEDTSNKPSSLSENTTDKDSKIPGIIKSTSFAQKRVSKIPVRRTASNQSLISSTIMPTTAESKAELVQNLSSPVDIPLQAFNQTEVSKSAITDDESDEELYSITSDSTATELDSRADEFQSPVSTNEMILMIQQEELENTSTIAPSTSSSTLHSTTSLASGLKSPADFIPSGDPSKQNLSELVEDTQRLIKQMKDEISIDDFESSTDEYTDEYSDEYDDGEEEEEDDEDWEEEEEEESEEDDEEYDNITEDIIEENEGNDYSNTQSPVPFSQDSQDAHISSDLANIPSASFDHSQALLSNHFEQGNTQNQKISVEETVAFVETENSSPELPVETVIDTLLEQPQNTVVLNESENLLPKMPVEAVLETVQGKQGQANKQHESEDTTALISSLQNILSAPLSIDHQLETENTLPELPAEVVIAEPMLTAAAVVNENTDSSIEVSTQGKTELNSQRAPQESQSISTITLLNEDNLSSTNVSNLSASSEVNNTSKQAPQATTALLNEDNLSPSNLTTKATENIQSATNQQNKVEMPSTSKQIKGTITNKKYIEKSQQINKDKQASALADTKNNSAGDAKITTKKPLAASKIPKPKEVPKDQKTKVAVAVVTKPQNEFKKKLYTRSKSFSGPPTPIGIASVKTISQKFINHPQTANQSNAVKKSQPTVARRSSIVETINKFTKPNNVLEKPAATSSLLFKSRTQPRIPKKKYHETCFSDDDYESTSSEEELEPLEIRQRKLSIPVFRAYPSVQQEPEEVNTEELIKKFMTDKLTSTIAEAQIAATLVAMKFQQDVAIWAAKECSDLDHAIALLKQECELCSGTYALNEIVSMLKCIHKCCKQCAKTYFTVQITERSINDCSCPFCKLPELHNQTEHEDENLEYFSNLDIFLKNILEPEVHELFQRKLRDRTLLKDPNFKWCVQCSSGFFARPRQKRLICPDCGSVTCAQCRKPWQKQHEGISCEQFAEWESANDPEVQAKGVQQHLEHNGIDCPKCKFRYSLARGGCMHFTCTQCKYEFCYGCAKPFMMGAKCTISPYCAKLGLHAHHPRNCLFYLRDKLPVQLQILLKNNGVTYEVDPIDVPEESSKDDEPTTSKKKELLCSIAIQKETPTGLVDTRCNGDVPDKHAGMCRTHYVEYLTAKVARAKIDPLPIFDLTDCVQELRRRGIPLPERGPWDTDEIYKNMCSEVIQKNIPLDAD